MLTSNRLIVINCYRIATIRDLLSSDDITCQPALTQFWNCRWYYLRERHHASDVVHNWNQWPRQDRHVLRTIAARRWSSRRPGSRNKLMFGLRTRVWRQGSRIQGANFRRSRGRVKIAPQDEMVCIYRGPGCRIWTHKSMRVFAKCNLEAHTGV